MPLEPVVAVVVLLAALAVALYRRTWKRKAPETLLGVVTPPAKDHTDAP